MTDIIRKAHLLSTVFGLVMVAAAGFQTTGPALILAMSAALTVLVGIAFRVAATVAVLVAAAAIVVSDAPPMLAALAGLSAAATWCCAIPRVGRPGSSAPPHRR